jgi:hypothetical protein
VWISDVPLACNEGVNGDAVLEVEIAEEHVADYEWIEAGTPYVNC